ncbi:MAG: DNA recombination protein RmuC [Ferrovum sp. 37-45-19]|uniref:DNA recombination protein RmuC n=1 Tax=Ferrovum sp. JA12 TaxID=1356299 RepID=UPI000703424D|nr:DNA recombination protein RmuC [Ferrovum sp. JA12]OYV79942.1 MAG: DNA recombination protein RmuC [Ferrovum sp. 21-44-67]OYV95567.1 MAG: DNA recombination protein RmuC [Ferrovum sp. 37-45-19]HQT81871.1 DNA recombination protein RmuC [Ferrovaceae bacterium]KRH78257.1 DNA recombination protein RmuC [Ferrovum sp. JA12]HQU05821.1 DNA recombination protein RmuC [Ferrovaceae bacterium]
MFMLIGIVIIIVLLLILLFAGKKDNYPDNNAFNTLKDELNKYQGNLTGRLETMVLQANQVAENINSLKTELQEKLDLKLTQLLSEARDERRVTTEAQSKVIDELRSDLNQRLSLLTQTINDQLMGTSQQLRETIQKRLGEIQESNDKKLEEMRRTVDEKLHATLEERLGEKFKLVSEHLDKVHIGLGEMKILAEGVGDLKKVFTNVKTRGTWGEVQLGSLLDQVLTQEQYQKNVITVPGSSDPVEFAIKLPGSDKDSQVWLPIDAKFPIEDYQRLVDAVDQGEMDKAEQYGKQLERRVKEEAKTIRQKYIHVPDTTDFAILFLPTEGLYAEVLRRPGLVDSIQNEYRISVAGPTTLMAILNSLQMGFRTLAIEQRSAEIWKTLGAIKSEFLKFGDVIEATRKKLDQATKQFDEVDRRTRVLKRTLRDVEELPFAEVPLLDNPEETDD